MKPTVSWNISIKQAFVGGVGGSWWGAVFCWQYLWLAGSFRLFILQWKPLSLSRAPWIHCYGNGTQQNPVKVFGSPPPLVFLRLNFSSSSHMRQKKKKSTVLNVKLLGVWFDFPSLITWDLSLSLLLPTPPPFFPHCAGKGLGISRIS